MKYEILINININIDTENTDTDTIMEAIEETLTDNPIEINNQTHHIEVYGIKEATHH